MGFKALKPEHVKYIVIHCSATPGTRDVSAADIDHWHRDKGWFMIGYHYVVRLDGTVEEGRKLEIPGAHAHGHNHESVGVCLVGGMEDGEPADTFTKDQWASLRVLVEGLLIQFPDAEVIGHRDLPDVHKECPCFDVKGWVNTWKQ